LHLLVEQNQTIVAYHYSNTRFPKFDLRYADADSHSGVGLFFHTKPKMWRGKFVYRCELRIGVVLSYFGPAPSTLVDTLNARLNSNIRDTLSGEQLLMELYKVVGDKYEANRMLVELGYNCLEDMGVYMMLSDDDITILDTKRA
jgi:hypothetical protein